MRIRTYTEGDVLIMTTATGLLNHLQAAMSDGTGDADRDRNDRFLARVRAHVGREFAVEMSGELLTTIAAEEKIEYVAPQALLDSPLITRAADALPPYPPVPGVDPEAESGWVGEGNA